MENNSNLLKIGPLLKMHAGEITITPWSVCDYHFVIRFSSATSFWNVYKRVNGNPITSYWKHAETLKEAFRLIAETL